MPFETYGGQEPFLFISYSHQDKKRIYPVIERLSSDGYRVWYDTNILPSREWSDTIAENLMNAELVIAFISDNYISSGNCRDELDYAKDHNKKHLLIYLDDVTLPMGMELRFGRVQAIRKFDYQNEGAFFEKLYTTDAIDRCKSPAAAGKQPVRSTTTLTYPDGSIYIGSVSNELPNGRGKMIYPDGCVYVGEFKNGKFHGSGKEWYFDIITYEGEFREGHPCGSGEERFADGTVYQGEFEDDKKSGTGKTVYADGSRYEGEYEDGLKNGMGIYAFEDGSLYEGSFSEGMMHGQGTMIWADGQKWTGEFKRGKPWNGTGIWHTPFDGILSGEWQDGVLKEKGDTKKS